MKKKRNFLEFQIISRLSYTNSARIQNRPYLHHLSTSLYQIATRFNSKNRKTYRSRLNCTTPYITQLSRCLPWLIRRWLLPSFFFFSSSFFISSSLSRLSLFFLNVRPSFLFMFWQLMVSVAVSAAGWSAASATTRGKNERRQSSRAGQAPYAAEEAEAIASIRRICWPSPGAGAHRQLARRPRRRTTRVFRVSTRRPPRPRSAPPRTNIRPRSRPCRTTVASPPTESRARRSRPWCPATATWRYLGDQERPVGVAGPPPRPRTDWSRFTTIWGLGQPRTVVRCCRWTRVLNHCPRWGIGLCPERRPPITAPYNEAPRTYWQAARSTDPRPRARLNGRPRSPTSRRTVRTNCLDNRRSSSSNNSNSRAVATRLIGKCHRDHRRNPRRSRPTGLFTRTRVRTARKYDRCTSAGEDEAARSWPWWAQGTHDRSHNKPVVPFEKRVDDPAPEGCRGSSIIHGWSAFGGPAGKCADERACEGFQHPVMRGIVDPPEHSGETSRARRLLPVVLSLLVVFPLSLSLSSCIPFYLFYRRVFSHACYGTYHVRVYVAREIDI